MRRDPIPYWELDPYRTHLTNLKIYDNITYRKLKIEGGKK